MIGHAFVAQSFGDLDGFIDTSEVGIADVIAAVVVVVATIVAAALISRYTRREFARPETRSEQLVRTAGSAAKWIVVFIGAAWALSLLGVNLGWFAITIVLLLVLIVLLVRPDLERFAAGVSLTTRPGFAVGDEIRIRDYRGEVLEITGRSTVLRLRDGTRVHIPNTDVIAETVTVYSIEKERRTSVELEVDGRHSVESVESVVLDALADVEVVASQPAPRVRARGFGDSSVKLSIRYWHDSGLQSESDALDQAVRAIARGLEEAGMDLADPQLLVQLRHED